MTGAISESPDNEANEPPNECPVKNTS